MVTRLNPYLSFRDNARDALEFYHTVFGGELTLNTFGDFHASEDPDEAQLIMHGMLSTDGGLDLAGADTPKRLEYTPGNNYSISLSGEDEAELRGYWNALIDGATITMPLEKAMWGDTFGMCTDRFGVSWMVNIFAAPEEAAAG